MAKEHRVFTLEFKREAVHLAQTSGKPKLHIARDLGIAASTLHRWCKQFNKQREEPPPDDGCLAPIEEKNSQLTQESEIRMLLTQIEAEYQAGKLGLSGLSEGTSRHEVIERRMTRIGELHSQLHTLVGDEATMLIAHALDASPEPPTSTSS